MSCSSVQYDVPLQNLRDTGAAISLWVRPPQADISVEELALFKWGTGAMTVPLAKCEVECDLLQGSARLGIVDSLPDVSGVDLILGNDSAKG